MRNKPPTPHDRLIRLKQRLGWKPRLIHTRIKPGGWVTMPRDMLHAMGLNKGDTLDIQIEDGRVLIRKRVATRQKQWLPQKRSFVRKDDAVRPAHTPLKGILTKFDRFSSEFTAEGRQDQIQRERERL